MTGGRVVVLGPTGRNFAAGMSGGLAFVRDPDGTAASRVNTDMVDIEPLTDDDRAWLRATVEDHHSLTGSAVAARVLADWDGQRWLKVFPKDFKRVLAAVRRAEEEGLDPDKLVMEAAHG
jgi:glutamate synthase (NADPH) large chain